MEPWDMLVTTSGGDGKEPRTMDGKSAYWAMTC